MAEESKKKDVDPLHRAYTKVQDAFREYLDVCRRTNQTPRGFGSRVLDDAHFIHLRYPESRSDGFGKTTLTVPKRVADNFKREDELFLPPLLSVFCSVCDGRGKVCTICGSPDSPEHTHKVASSTNLVRVWDHCPICVEPFLPTEPTSKEPEAQAFNPSPDSAHETYENHVEDVSVDEGEEP